MRLIVNAKRDLAALATTLGAIAIVAFICILVLGLNPSERAKALHGGLRVSLADIERGNYKTIRWLTNPVVIMRPNTAVLNKLREINGLVWGPPTNGDSRPIAFVYIAKSTYMGCPLADMKTHSYYRNFEGWFDPCHIGAWDYSGRAYKGVNVPSLETHLENLKAIAFDQISEEEIEIHQ
ncbi:MAG: hypothetical protein IPG43_03130 [Proteobacteria bacterium]|nr:hypothetical protein [Pseudomonadota bacterium]